MENLVACLEPQLVSVLLVSGVLVISVDRSVSASDSFSDPSSSLREGSALPVLVTFSGGSPLKSSSGVLLRDEKYFRIDIILS